ncbi:MAG: TetR/AcrR family transcriptional regulator [Clostridia bacterium]|nr:TetR/AcrR family transcriptional regulator [Clostridia bacterium]
MKKQMQSLIDEMPLRERLILAGIEEIRTGGISSLSLRRIAKICSVSSAAPYKHFENKQEFVIAVIDYISKQWDAQLEKVVSNIAPEDYRKQLISISLEYIRFLVENPHFRSIIMLKDEGLTPEQIKLKSQLSEGSRQVIAKYCQSVNMSDDRRIIKTFIVRSIIYGAALMMDNGEMEYTDDNMNEISKTIEREFDLG